MERILTQDEIDALFEKAQAGGGSGATSGKPRSVATFDLRQAGQLTSEQVRAVTALHETFARRITSSLGAFLRVGFEVNLQSVEQLSYGEFLGRLPDRLYLATVRIQPLTARATIRADLSLVFPIVDLVLGGSGKDEPEPRDLTEIEAEILETVIRIICQELQVTWNPVLDLEFQFDQHQQQANVRGLMLSSEKILSIGFEVRLPDARGTVDLAFPAVVSNALLRKLAVQGSYSERASSNQSERRLRERLLDCRFSLDLSLRPSPVTVGDLMELRPGSTLVLGQRVADPVPLSVAGKNMFEARAIQRGRMRAAQIENVLSIADTHGKEDK